MMATLDTPLPKEAQLNWRREFESRLWSMTLLWLACFWVVAWMGMGLEPPSPMVQLLQLVVVHWGSVKMQVQVKDHRERHKEQKYHDFAELVDFPLLDFELHLIWVSEHKAMAVSSVERGKTPYPQLELYRIADPA